MKKKLVALLTPALIMGLLTSCQSIVKAENYTQQSELNSEKSESDAEDLGQWKSNEVNITLGEKINISGKGAVVNGSDVIILTGGIYTVSGTLADGSIIVNTEEKVKIKLNGATINNSDGAAISILNADKAFITIVEGTDNYISDGTVYAENEEAKGAIFSNDTLEIKGKGNLTVTGNYKHGIVSDDDIIIKNGNITVSSVKDGFHANDDITVNGGNITVLKAVDAFESEGTFSMNDGTLNLAADDDGISAAGDVTINGGNIYISKCEEGVESKTNLTINGGKIEVTANDDGLNAGTSIEINDGYIYTTVSRGDGIDSNGTITINGGVVLGYGSNEPEGGLDCDDNKFLINGGIVIGTGGINSSPDSSSAQNSVSFGNIANAGSIVRIECDGEEVITFKVEKTASSILLSCPKLETGKKYTVYTAGAVTEAENFHGVYTSGVQYSDGTQNTEFEISSTVTQLGGNLGMGMGGMGGGRGQGGGPQGGQFGNGQGGKFNRNDMTMPDGIEPPAMPDGTEPPAMPDGMQPPSNDFSQKFQGGMNPNQQTDSEQNTQSQNTI